MGRRGADMRRGQCMKALSMGPVSHCPMVPSCHFHFAPSSPESSQLWYKEGVQGMMGGARGGFLKEEVGEKDRVCEVWNKIAFYPTVQR